MSLTYAPLADGSLAVDFDLPGTDGVRHSLASEKGENGIVIVWMCNHCPYVKGVLERLKEIAAVAKNEGFGFVGINSNDAVRYPDDSFAAMEKMALPFVYLHDESQEIAKKYGAVCTPDILVYDKDLKQVYRGRVEELEDAIAGRDVAHILPSFGCNIKWKI